MRQHYYLHLSDLHFGDSNLFAAQKRLEVLVRKQLNDIGSQSDIDVIITGDMLESPKKSYYEMYKTFAEKIQTIIAKPPICIIGNHDVYNHGLALLSDKKIANQINDYLYKERIIIDDIHKVILLKFNSVTDQALLAEGKIGSTQLEEMDSQLDKVNDLHEYTLIALLHHHVTDVPKPDWYDKKWIQNMFPTIEDQTLKLVDAELFLEWLTLRHVTLVLHGHRHIPFIEQIGPVHVVACGSSTGDIGHVDKEKTCISYNVIKIDQKTITCVQYVEEILGSGAKQISTAVFHSDDYKTIKIHQHPELIPQAAGWFSQKWGIAKEIYVESMEGSLKDNSKIPRWYIMWNGEDIIAGVGVIENDFHNRKDLTPNICALYVEEDYRNQGIAGGLLQFVCNEYTSMGIDTLYLITEHTSFYERYGWEFLCMVQEDGKPEMIRMYQHIQREISK